MGDLAKTTYDGYQFAAKQDPRLAALAFVGYMSISLASGSNYDSIGNLDLSSLTDEKVIEAKMQSDAINNTPYKYLITTSSGREKFIEEIDNLIDEVSKVESYSKEYKQAIISYANLLKQINADYKESKKTVDYIKDNPVYFIP